MVGLGVERPMHVQVPGGRIEEIPGVDRRLRGRAEFDLLCRRADAQIDLGLAILCHLEGEVQIDDSVFEGVISRHGIFRQLDFAVERAVRRKRDGISVDLRAVRVFQTERHIGDRWQFITTIERLPRRAAEVDRLPRAVNGTVGVHVDLIVWCAYIL